MFYIEIYEMELHIQLSLFSLPSILYLHPNTGQRIL